MEFLCIYVCVTEVRVQTSWFMIVLFRKRIVSTLQCQRHQKDTLPTLIQRPWVHFMDLQDPGFLKTTVFPFLFLFSIILGFYFNHPSSGLMLQAAITQHSLLC